MSKRALDKIRTGLDSARCYLDGSADKTSFGVHAPKTPDEMGPGAEAVPAKPEGTRSNLKRPGMRGGFKSNRRR